MCRLFRNFLILFLLQLQLFAPLLHAHVEEHASNKGLHLPGLEFHANLLSGINLQAQDYDVSFNHLVVSIDNGFQDKRAALVDDAEKPVLLMPILCIPGTSMVKTDWNFSPQSLPLYSSQPKASFSPRAPPLLSLVV